MRVTKNIHLGLFWLDVRYAGRWRWHGYDLIRAVKSKLEEYAERNWQPHPLALQCPSFGHFYTSAGYDENVGCSIRFDKPCRISKEAEAECQRVTHLDMKERLKIGVR